MTAEKDKTLSPTMLNARNEILVEFGDYTFDQYWQISNTWPSFREALEIAQGLQIIDIVYSALGVTNNSLGQVAPQILSRLAVLWYVLPYVSHGNPAVFMATLCWSITEVVRFTFYSLKTLDIDISTNLQASIVGHLRYNSFIILYPVGVTGELLCFYSCWLYCIKRREAAMSVPLTLKLPNAYNFAFDYPWFISRLVPFVYSLALPMNYMTLLAQRSKYFAGVKKEKVDDSKGIKKD